jgi:hypothetical protein
MGALPSFADDLGKEFGFGRLGVLGLRMRVRWASDRLTRDLAAGADSVASRELALRAGQLTAKGTREVVAHSIEDLVEQLDRPATLSSQVPLDRVKLTAVRGPLLEFAQRLRSAQPVRPQGMALALLLLTDPERQLYGIGTKDELSSAISEARERLGRPAAAERRSPPLPPIEDREPNRRRRP